MQFDSSANMKNEAAQGEDLTVEELTEKEIKTVVKFHRQLSSHSILSIQTEDGLDEPDGPNSEVYDREMVPDPEVETITQEEALVMQKVLRAFGYTDQEKPSHEVEVKKTYRLSSSEIYEASFYSTSLTSRFISPGRFYVSEEMKAIVRDIHDKIIHKKPCPDTADIDCVRVKFQETLKSEEWNNVPDNIEIEMTKISNATNGHAEYTDLSRFPPKERFKELARRALRRKREEEFYTRLWKKRGTPGWFDLIFTIIGLCAFFADSGTDIKVASDHFSTDHPWWGTFTLILVFVPTILVNIVSYFFYKEDEDRGTVPESGWKAVKITHIFQVGLVERYWRILSKGYKIKFKKLQGTLPRLTLHYQLYIAMNLDVAMLQMILAFTEDAPQLVLQLYVLIRRHLVETLQISKVQDLWTIASIVFSFISYSRATVNYISCFRKSKKHKGLLRWYGYVAMLFWRSFMFISRILVLVFFASEFHLWFFLVLFLHFFIVLALMKSQKVEFFPGQKGRQFLIRVVIAYIHTFCFFVLDASKTIKWALIYYILTAIEAIIFSSLWFTNAYREISLRLQLAGLSVIFISYTFGLLMMVVYYKFLHPKFS